MMKNMKQESHTEFELWLKYCISLVITCMSFPGAAITVAINHSVLILD